MLQDADILVQLPRGCGEQNMARLATNLLALTFLDPASTPAAIAKDHVARGIVANKSMTSSLICRILAEGKTDRQIIIVI